MIRLREHADRSGEVGDDGYAPELATLAAVGHRNERHNGGARRLQIGRRVTDHRGCVGAGAETPKSFLELIGEGLWLQVGHGRMGPSPSA